MQVSGNGGWERGAAENPGHQATEKALHSVKTAVTLHTSLCLPWVPLLCGPHLLRLHTKH